MHRLIIMSIPEISPIAGISRVCTRSTIRLQIDRDTCHRELKAKQFYFRLEIESATLMLKSSERYVDSNVGRICDLKNNLNYNHNFGYRLQIVIKSKDNTPRFTFPIIFVIFVESINQ